MIFGPFSLLFALFFFALLVFLFVFVQIGVITYAFERIGIGSENLFLLLVLTLVGSYVNIPVTTIEGELEPAGQIISCFGYRFVIPRPWRPRRTVVAVNVGGAVIPALLASYLVLTHPSLWLAIGVALIGVTVVARAIARPVRGLGIASPPLVAPAVAALCALLFAPEHAPVVAYAAGTLGVLIGADLLNMHRLADIGAPVVSIGGAGTFDGVFLTGILAVLLAGL